MLAEFCPLPGSVGLTCHPVQVTTAFAFALHITFDTQSTHYSHYPRRVDWLACKVTYLGLIAS